ncbi:MAG: hypothetical protein RR306_06510, partial [Clostridia bacterium]
MRINSLLSELSDYSEKTLLAMKEDRIYNINRALAFLKLDDFSYEEYTQHEDISFLLEDIFIYALENKIVTDGSITNQDIFTSELI